MLSKLSSGTRVNAAEETIEEAKRLYHLAEQLNKVSQELEDDKQRNQIKTIVREVLQASRNLSSIVSN